ncbi:MAG TPA: BTAD domain-containing putative transcriptional regulator [Ilumatobacteraceae bacterium]|nr:BTAD domain-containing putative transcriptional regulator [Ilumatobacteraceae bacterium]
MTGHREPRYRVLGPLAVSSGDGTPVALRGDLQRRLVAALVLHVNRPLATDAVADLLWGDALPDDIAGAVQTHVSRLRRVLPPDSLVYGDGGYCLDVADDDLDSDQFDRMVTEGIQARRVRPEEAIEWFDAALALWRGSPYAEFVDWDAARAEASRLEELWLLANEERFDALLAVGRHEESLADLVSLAAEHPLRDRTRALLMTALYRAGRQPEALQAYEEHRRHLADELGLDPSPALRDLERSMLDHTLDVPRPREQSVGATASVLPNPATRLIGRDRLVGELREILRTARTVTITGPGGVGKTRLAVELAHAIDGESDDGDSGGSDGVDHFDHVAFCELAAVGRGDEVVPAVATTLGVESRSDIPIESRLVEALRGRRVLLVLDNCEHVIDAAANLVERIVTATTTVSILATSRERLAVSGEHVCAVEPLDDVLAGELFIERSRTVRPGFTPSEAEEADVLYICHQLDGLPLAIELAAARSQALSVREIADALSQRFRLLTGGRRTAERHRSLVETVRWSFDLLDDHEREVCEQLAVFSGGATVESVAGVTGLDRVAAADVIARLVERSLLTVSPDAQGATRFQMLETLRQYGIDRLAERDAVDTVRRAHARHFVRMASEHYAALRRPNDADRVFAAIDADIANLRAAHAWLVDRADADALAELSVSLFDFGFQAMRPEIFGWVEASLDVVAADDPRRAELLDSVCYGRWQFGDVDGAWAALREGLALAVPGTRAHRGLLAAHMNLEGRAGNLDVAIPLAIEAAALAAAAGDTVWFAVERFQELLVRGLAGDASAAEEAELWTIDAQSEGNPIVSCWARYAAGEVLADDDPERARRHIDAALELAEMSGCRFVKGVAGLTAASLEARNGDPRRAAVAYRELLDVWQIGSLGPVGVTIMRGVVEVLASLGDPETAAVLHGAVAVSNSSPAFGPDAYRQSALSRRLRRDLGEAAFEAAVERGGQLDDVELRELAAIALGRAGSDVDQHSHQRG